MKETKKQRQVAALIQKDFSIVLKAEGAFIYGVEAMVTVTSVRMSSDLGIAYIYLSVFNVEDKEDIIKKMWANLSRFRGELGNRIRSQVRRIPVLKFYIDETLDEIEHIDNLFSKLHASNNNSMRSMKEALADKQNNKEA